MYMIEREKGFCFDGGAGVVPSQVDGPRRQLVSLRLGVRNKEYDAQIVPPASPTHGCLDDGTLPAGRSQNQRDHGKPDSAQNAAEFWHRPISRLPAGIWVGFRPILGPQDGQGFERSPVFEHTQRASSGFLSFRL